MKFACLGERNSRSTASQEVDSVRTASLHLPTSYSNRVLVAQLFPSPSSILKVLLFRLFFLITGCEVSGIYVTSCILLILLVFTLLE